MPTPLPHRWVKIKRNVYRCDYCYAYYIHDLPSDRYNQRMQAKTCRDRTDYVARHGREKG